MTDVNITLPTSWHELSQKQLRYIYTMIALGLSVDEVKTYCLFHWSKIKILHRYGDNGYMCKLKKKCFIMTAEEVAASIGFLDWMRQLPTLPVRLEKIGRHRAAPADLQGLALEAFIICDNLYQGYLSTQKEELLDEMAEHLYGTKHLDAAERINIFYWFASVKSMLAREFSNFFQPMQNDSSNMFENEKSQYEILKAAVNAQIRALTKGDVTKEKEVLAMDIWRALTELDAQAREYEELRKQYPH